MNNYNYDDISIHALLAESDQQVSLRPASPHQFLSTLSLRRATSLTDKAHIVLTISIHALLAESDKPCYPFPFLPHISIHALLAESDRRTRKKSMSRHQFLSTLSLRRATYAQSSIISIKINFYPRSPCGERHDKRFCFVAPSEISIHALLAESDYVQSAIIINVKRFLSTLSLRRATLDEAQRKA